MTEKVIAFLSEHKAKVISVIFSTTAAILMLTIGFWRTALVVAFILIGFKCGSIIDNGGSIVESFISFCIKIRDIFRNKT